MLNLKGGPAAQLETLADAAGLIADMEAWRHSRPVWDHAAGEILKAAISGEKADIEEATRCIEEATRCIEVALKQERWLRD